MLDPGAGLRSSSKKFLEEFSCSFVDIYMDLLCKGEAGWLQEKLITH